ncbi:unnamed protein product, partial [Didymodactylos carnosus]
DNVASFKAGHSFTVAGKQYYDTSQSINLLVSSNRYGHVFYATQNKGLAILPSSYIDKNSKHLTKTLEETVDADDTANNDNVSDENDIYYAPFMSTNNSYVPIWLALNSDETILSVLLSDENNWMIILYDVIKLIQMIDNSTLCSMSFSDSVGGTIHSLAWNPVINNLFALMDGSGSVYTYEYDTNIKTIKNSGKSEQNEDNACLCWSPKGKHLVVANYDGSIQLYETNMKLGNAYPTANPNSSAICVNILWLSAKTFLFGYCNSDIDDTENNLDNNEENFYLLSATYEKHKNTSKILIYNDLFFDVDSSSSDIQGRYFFSSITDWKVIFCGLTKSAKVNVLGGNELSPPIDRAFEGLQNGYLFYVPTYKDLKLKKLFFGLQCNED